MGDPTRGLYPKFHVERLDATDWPGQKHYGCDYLVLDYKHDPFAREAALAYADACEEEYPLLAQDIRNKVDEHSRGLSSDVNDKEPSLS